MLSEEQVVNQIDNNRENIVVVDVSKENIYVSQILYDTTNDKYTMSYVPINNCSFYASMHENFAIEDVQVTIDGSGNIVYDVFNCYSYQFWTNVGVYDALKEFHKAEWTHPTIEKMFRTPHFK